MERQIQSGLVQFREDDTKPPFRKAHLVPTESEEALDAQEQEIGEEVEEGNVAYWVRNLTRGQFAFRLPLSDRGFYPDFVVMLKDGRISVIEYKGAVYRTNDDSKEKELIGKLWAARSGGRCVFDLVGRDDMHERIENSLLPKSRVS